MATPPTPKSPPEPFATREDIERAIAVLEASLKDELKPPKKVLTLKPKKPKSP